MTWRRKRSAEHTFLVAGIRCPNCESSLKIALRALPGVRSIKISKKKQVTVESKPDHHLNRIDLIAAIERAGYRVVDAADARAQPS